MKRLNFRTGKSQDGLRYYIDEIPDEDWDKFKERAKKLFPEKGDKAWAEYIVKSIESILDGEKDIFIMTDIPPENLALMNMANEKAETHNMQVFAHLLDTAGDGNYHIINFKSDTKDKKHSLVLTNVPDGFWKEMERIAAEGRKVSDRKNLSAAELLADIISFMSENNLQIDAKKT